MEILVHRQNPVHTYNRGGAYTVSLNVTNTKGTNTRTQPGYIIVNGDKIGIFRNSTGDWKLDYNNSGAVSKAFHSGHNGRYFRSRGLEWRRVIDARCLPPV